MKRIIIAALAAALATPALAWDQQEGYRRAVCEALQTIIMSKTLDEAYAMRAVCTTALLEEMAKKDIFGCVAVITQENEKVQAAPPQSRLKKLIGIGCTMMILGVDRVEAQKRFDSLVAWKRHMQQKYGRD